MAVPRVVPMGPGRGGGVMGSGRGPKKVTVSSNSKHILSGRGFRVIQMVHGPMGAQGRAPIAFLIDDIPLGAP